MALIEINRNPSRRELLVFGALLAAFCGLIGALLRFQFGWAAAGNAVWGIGVLLWAAQSLIPALRRPLYLGWMYAAFPIGWLISHMLLTAVYFLVLTPIGLTMRLLGRDPMHRRLDRKRPTYWLDRKDEADSARYFRQF